MNKVLTNIETGARIGKIDISTKSHEAPMLVTPETDAAHLEIAKVHARATDQLTPLEIVQAEESLDRGIIQNSADSHKSSKLKTFASGVLRVLR